MRLSLGIVLVVVVLAVGQARGEDDRFCKSLKYFASSDEAALLSASDAFELALAHMKKMFAAGWSTMEKQVDDWRKVLANGDCDARTAERLDVVSSCNLEGEYGALSKMAEVVRAHSKKCLKTGFWHEQLKEILKADENERELRAFLSDQFISQYREDNPNEQSRLDLAAISVAACCKPNRSHGALLRALQPAFGNCSVQEVVDQIDENRNQLQSVLDARLFKPCERYLNKLGPLFENLSSRAENSAATRNLPLEFQDVIFRYIYCEHMSQMRDAKTKMLRLDVNKFFQAARSM